MEEGHHHHDQEAGGDEQGEESEVEAPEQGHVDYRREGGPAAAVAITAAPDLEGEQDHEGKSDHEGERHLRTATAQLAYQLEAKAQGPVSVERRGARHRHAGISGSGLPTRARKASSRRRRGTTLSMATPAAASAATTR